MSHASPARQASAGACFALTHVDVAGRALRLIAQAGRATSSPLPALRPFEQSPGAPSVKLASSLGVYDWAAARASASRRFCALPLDKSQCQGWPSGGVEPVISLNAQGSVRVWSALIPCALLRRVSSLLRILDTYLVTRTKGDRRGHRRPRREHALPAQWTPLCVPVPSRMRPVVPSACTRRHSGSRPTPVSRSNLICCLICWDLPCHVPERWVRGTCRIT